MGQFRGEEIDENMTQASYKYRLMKWKLKNVHKQLGSQGQTIYDLRCRVAELQEMIGKENRGFYRRLETMLAARDDELGVLRGEIDRLREKLENERTTHC